MRVGLATIQRGRPRHLARQVLGVLGQTRAPDRWVVVSMDHPADPAFVGALAPAGDRVAVERLPVPDGAPLPLAAARNRAIAALGDVDLAVLLDVDCVPARGCLAAYADGHARTVDAGPTLLAGPVGHLPAGRPAGDRVTDEDRHAATASAARPIPPPGTLEPGGPHELFWSLSFAVAPAVHARVGGFDEGYRGYGGEDTDYAFAARAAGVDLTWVGGAWAHHQHHPVQSPPREHVGAIVPNARRFRARWGRWPMEGWLRAFADEGLVAWDPDGDRLELAARG